MITKLTDILVPLAIIALADVVGSRDSFQGLPMLAPLRPCIDRLRYVGPDEHPLKIANEEEDLLQGGGVNALEQLLVLLQVVQQGGEPRINLGGREEG